MVELVKRRELASQSRPSLTKNDIAHEEYKGENTF